MENNIADFEIRNFIFSVICRFIPIWKHKTNRGRLVLDKVLSNALLFTCMWRQ